MGVTALGQVYTNIRKFKEDLGRYPPHHFVCVPLVLDTLFGRVRTPTPCPNTLHMHFAIPPQSAKRTLLRQPGLEHGWYQI